MFYLEKFLEILKFVILRRKFLNQKNKRDSDAPQTPS